MIEMHGDKELVFYLGNLGKNASMAVRRIISSSALLVKRAIQLNLSGRILRVRTNKLRSNWQIMKGGDSNNPWATLGTKTVYAAIQNYGGTIRPRVAKYLAIPLPGVKGSPKDYPHAFLLRLHGKLFLAIYGSYKKVKGPYMDPGARMLTGKKFKVLFVLKRQVVIPAHPYLEPALSGSIPGIENIIRQEATRLMNES